MRYRLSKPSTCRGCPLEFIGSGFSEPEGSGANGVLALGEALGHNEAHDGLPFRPHAEAGSLLNRAFGMAGMRRESFVLYNIIACQPPKNELVKTRYEFAAIEHCKVHWMKVVEQFKPKAILALGAVALRTLTGLTGDRLNLEYLRGYSLDSILGSAGVSGSFVAGGVDGRQGKGNSGIETTSLHTGTTQQLSIPVVATYHPSHVKRGKWQLLPVIVKDIRFAVDVAQHGPPPLGNLHYVTDGHEGQLEEMRDTLRANPDYVLSTDIETNYSEIIERSEFDTPEVLVASGQMKQQVTQVNLSIEEGTALVVDCTPNKLELVRQIHEVDCIKTGHNLLMFDQPVCDDNGIKLYGPLEDTMWRFHHLFPDLPGTARQKVDDTLASYGFVNADQGTIANLQYVANFAGFPLPWKHLSGSDPGWYGGCDADATLRAFWWTQDELERLGVMHGYQSMVVALMPILANMCRRGIPVHASELVELHEQLVKAVKGIDEKIQTHIPKEVLPFAPARGWKKPPADMASVIEIDVDLDAETRVCCFRVRKEGKNPKLYQKYAESSHARFQDGKLIAPNPDCPKCGGVGVISLPNRTERRWARELPFNAASSNQMFDYARWKGYKVPKNSKREVSMDAEVVGKLAKTYKDPVFTLCDDKRGLVKLDTTYCVGWMPGDDGRVHSQVGPYPATGQLSGRNPNPQNVPNLSKMEDKPEKLKFATGFRRALWAEPDHVIVELDWKSFHIQTLGFEAGDPVYIGLGKTDIHSFFAVTGILKVESRDALMKAAEKNLSLGRGDAELGARLKWYRKNYKLKNGASFDSLRNKQAKIAILAYGLGQQHGSLYRQNEDSFSSEDEAKRLVQSMNWTFPKEFHYRENTPLTVRPNGYRLINRYGFLRWFFGVQKLNRAKGIWEHGDDWEACIAFNVQASAHGHLRECCKINEALGYNERFGFDNTVHDSLRFHCHRELLDELIACVVPVMEHESKIMLMPWDNNRGLSVEVEVKVGPNWADMKEYHMPIKVAA